MLEVGTLVKIIATEETGVITEFISLERGKNPQPVVIVDGRLRLYGSAALEVVSEYR